MTRADDDDWLEFPYMPGLGSLYDLRDADEAKPRLAGLRSVRQVNVRLHDKPQPPRRAIGFHIPGKR